jgi:tetratricopeptide (TPR) repeat protein
LNPLLVDHHRTLLAAQGYSELEMHDTALTELHRLPPDLLALPEVLELHLSILMNAHRFPEALPLAERLIDLLPKRNMGYIQKAFCLHELGQSAEARECLLNGPESLREEPTFHYNLACYECALGDLDTSRRHLDTAFRMDKKFREFAKTDPDLRALREANS